MAPSHSRRLALNAGNSRCVSGIRGGGRVLYDPVRVQVGEVACEFGLAACHKEAPSDHARMFVEIALRVDEILDQQDERRGRAQVVGFHHEAIGDAWPEYALRMRVGDAFNRRPWRDRRPRSCVQERVDVRPEARVMLEQEAVAGIRIDDYLGIGDQPAKQV